MDVFLTHTLQEPSPSHLLFLKAVPTDVGWGVGPEGLYETRVLTNISST